MPQLPNGDKAFVPVEKFTEYSLNPEHPTGRHKAHVFKVKLGITLEDVDFMVAKVQAMAADHEATEQTPIAYGRRFVIDFELTTEVGSAIVRSSWIVRKDEDFPRLTSCYVLED